MVSGNSVSSGAGSYSGGVDVNGTFTMSGGTVSGNSVSSALSSFGGGVYVNGTFTMSGGTVSGNSISSALSSFGGGVHVEGGPFTKQPGAVIYGSNESDSALKNTASYDAHAVYFIGPFVGTRNATADRHVTLDSSLKGSAGGWEEPPPTSGISGIAYSNTWALQPDGRRMSPAISNNSVSKSRVSFTSTVANANITVQLDVSSGYDFAFISTLDNGSASYDNGYYPGSNISGTRSVTLAIPILTPGSHFIDICYQKSSSGSSGSDCAWFKVIE
jgi:hypothetical protein